MESNVSAISIIKIVLVFILIIVLIGILFFVNISDNEIITIKGTITYVGNNYILVVDNDNVEYKLDTSNNFSVGDTLTVSVKDLDKKKTPIEATIVEVNYIGKSNDMPIDNIDNVVKYFSDLNNSLDNFVDNQQEALSIKERYVSMIDFLFYNKELKGFFFKDLDDDIKLKLMKDAYIINDKVDEKIPNFKSEISRTSSKIYSDVKNRIVVSYLDITSRVCINNNDMCSSAKEGIKDLRDNYGLTWDFIDNLSSISSAKIKSWYDIWKEI